MLMPISGRAGASAGNASRSLALLPLFALLHLLLAYSSSAPRQCAPPHKTSSWSLGQVVSRSLVRLVQLGYLLAADLLMEPTRERDKAREVAKLVNLSNVIAIK